MLNDRNSYMLLCAILAVGLIGSFVLYSGPYYAFDDNFYIIYAHQILTSGFTVIGHPYAYGYLFPTYLALSIALLGTSVYSVILPSLLGFLIIITLTFLIGKELYGNEVELIAAFLACTAPFVLCYTTRVLPDIPLGVITAAALYLFVKGLRRNNDYYYLGAGSFAALGVFVKITDLAFLLFFSVAALFLLLYKNRRSGSLFFAKSGMFLFFAGMLVVFAIYLLSIYVMTGSAFYTLSSYGAFQNSISPSSLTNNIGTLTTLLIGYTTGMANFRQQLETPDVTPLGFIAFFAIIGAAMGLLRKERGAIYLSIILFGAGGYLFFGTTSLSSYTFAYVVPRYFTFVVAPMAVLAAMATTRMSSAMSKGYAGGMWRGAICCGILAVIMASNFLVYLTMYQYNTAYAGDTRTFYSVLDYTGSKNTTIVTADSQSALFFSFLSGYRNSTNLGTLDIYHTNNLLMQMSNLCQNNSDNGYVAIVYNNNTKNDYQIVTARWPYTNCTLTKVGDFYDRASNSSIFNSMDVHITLYKLTKSYDR